MYMYLVMSKASYTLKLAPDLHLWKQRSYCFSGSLRITLPHYLQFHEVNVDAGPGRQALLNDLMSSWVSLSCFLSTNTFIFFFAVDLIFACIGSMENEMTLRVSKLTL